jgi:hypothetical protein
MPRIAYVEKKFSPAHLNLIHTAEGICRDYAAQRYDHTLTDV